MSGQTCYTEAIDNHFSLGCKVKIKSISVQKLFDTFNHTVEINQQSGITVLYGSNGFGKTTLLNMTESLFSAKFRLLQSVPFLKFNIILDNNMVLSVEKVKQQASLKFCLENADSEASEQNTVYIMPDVGMTQGELPTWLGQIINAVSVRSIKVASEVMFDVYSNGKDETWLVDFYSQDIVLRIGRTLEAFAELSYTIDRKFPHQIDESSESSIAINPKILGEKLEALEQKYTRLTALGLLGRNEIGIENHSSNIEIKVLSIYVKNMDEKLSVFDDLVSRLDIFRRIVEARFDFKKLIIDREKGFRFLLPDNTHININHLSSGEQCEFIRFYQLLFFGKDNELILIDDPEISLHVRWQRKFLADIESITKVRPVNFLIATHSPSIIGERWDWSVALKKPEEEAV